MRHALSRVRRRPRARPIAALVTLLRPSTGSSAWAAEAIKVVARAHKTMMWERTRHTLRLRQLRREYFPYALEAFDDLDAPDVLELPTKAPDPASATKLARRQSVPWVQHCPAPRRRYQDHQDSGDPSHLTAGPGPGDHYLNALTTRSIVAVLGVLNEQIDALRSAGGGTFRDTRTVRSSCPKPGMGPVLGARALFEFYYAPDHDADVKSRKNYAGTSPITRVGGKKKIMHARFIHNDQLIGAPLRKRSRRNGHRPVPRAYYDKLANRLVGILHGCLKTRTAYDEANSWHINAWKTPPPNDIQSPGMSGSDASGEAGNLRSSPPLIGRNQDLASGRTNGLPLGQRRIGDIFSRL